MTRFYSNSKKQLIYNRKLFSFPPLRVKYGKATSPLISRFILF